METTHPNSSHEYKFCPFFTSCFLRSPHLAFIENRGLAEICQLKPFCAGNISYLVTQLYVFVILECWFCMDCFTWNWNISNIHLNVFVSSLGYLTELLSWPLHKYMTRRDHGVQPQIFLSNVGSTRRVSIHSNREIKQFSLEIYYMGYFLWLSSILYIFTLLKWLALNVKCNVMW